ncbi:MAG: DUF2062 domain-containing protein [Nitrospirae bacterium]|nr:DUF2062 domain-containing protein [Nitrospirota bacterium]MBF0593035.1 DUF2062 domain-containing protein [Nitrospirota bacterium]
MIKKAFKALLGIEDSPMKVALSFGFGTFIGFSPLVGLHTVLVVILAMLFKLNRVALFTGAYINNPFTIVPISTFCTWVGIKLLRMDIASVAIDFSNIKFSISGFHKIANALGVLLMPFVWGSAFVAVIAGGLSFFIMLYVLRLKKRLQKAPTPSYYPPTCEEDDKFAPPTCEGDDRGGI